MRLVGWFDIVTGLAIAGLWWVLLVTRQVPELADERREILFHLVAELSTALLLVVAGVAVLTAGAQVATVLAALAAGSLLYTTVNSAGYYAQRRQWAVVAMFGVLAAATVATAAVLVGSVG